MRRAHIRKRLLACSILALAAFSAPAALAQSGAAAQADEGGDLGLDIVVTARRVEERLQDVPISITVFTPDQIANRNIVEPSDLTIYTPSLATTGIFGRENTQYAIRGFSQANRTAASVAVYFADVVAPRSGPSTPAGDGAGLGQFLDLQNVQVLKGPQGTLFGRNTTGGAVLMVPHKPTDDFGGYVEAMYGNYDWKGLQGVVNLPLSDVARLRLAGEFQDRDGLTKNVGIGPDVDDRHYYSLRASLVVDLTPTLENYMIASFAKSDNNGTLFNVLGCVPNNYPLGFLACPGADRQAARSVHTAESDVADPYFHSTRWGIVNTTTWTASDNLTIKNIAGYQELKSHIYVDLFGTNFSMPAVLPVPAGPNVLQVPTGALAGTPITFIQTNSRNQTDQYTFSEELRLQGQSSDGSLIWQAGGYFERSAPLSGTRTYSTTLIRCTGLAAQLARQCTDPLGAIYSATFQRPVAVGSISERFSSIGFRNIGLYAQSTYSISDQLKVTGGFRYSWDRVRGTSRATAFRFLPPNPTVPVASCIDIGTTVAQGCAGAPLRKTSSAPTWLIGLDYTPSNNVLLYAKYSRGYRQGSVSPNAADGYATFDPEKVDTYEVGTKLSFEGAVRGYFNVSAFYNKFSDQQIAATFTPSQASGLPQADGIVNAGRSRIYGAEIEAVISPVTGLTFAGSYAYLNTKLQSLDPIVLLPGSVYVTGTSSSRVGDALPFTPKHKFTVSGTYELPVDESIGRISFGAVYAYTGSQLSTVAAGPFYNLPSYGTLNLNFNWREVGGSPIDLSLFGTNVTNEKYLNNASGLGGFYVGRYGEQRIYGVKVRYNFGS